MAPSERSGPASAIGVDVGGSGIKGAPVDVVGGAFAADRVRIPTPQPATPAAVAATIAEVLGQLGGSGPTGITMPAVVRNGVVETAANIDPSWIGVDAADLFGTALGRPVAVLNDADAAGLAEEKFGAGKDNSGVIVLLTFGTGIGSAVIHNGILLPNTEFGHLEVGGKEAEHRAASSVKDRKEWSYERWTEEVTKVLVVVENAIWPDLFIAGGGISRKADKWIPLLKNRTPVVAATLLNTAGIVGAAMATEVEAVPT